MTLVYLLEELDNSIPYSHECFYVIGTSLDKDKLQKIIEEKENENKIHSEKYELGQLIEKRINKEVYGYDDSHDLVCSPEYDPNVMPELHAKYELMVENLSEEEKELHSIYYVPEMLYRITEHELI